MQLFVQRRLLARDTLRRRVWVSSAALLNLKPQKRCLAAVPSLNDAGPTPGRGRPKNDLKKPIQVLSLPSLKQRVSIEELPSQDKLAETVGEPLVDSDEDTSRFLATPLLREIAQLESQYPDHLILVQVGSFYEIYETQKLSKDKKWGLDEIANFLNLRIAKKKLKVTAGSAMDVLRFAGFPMTKAKEYIDLLLRNGFTVAIADQTARDTSSKTKNFVRSVTRIITPGTQLQDELELDLKDNNFLLSVDFLDSNQDLFKSTSKVGLAWTDVSTGEFYVAEIPFSRLEGELSRIQPSEILLSEVFRSQVGRPGHPLYKLFNTQDGSSKEFFVNFKGLDIFDVSVQPFDSLINKDGLKIGKDFTLAEARVGSVLLNYLYQSFPCSKPSLRDPVDVSQEEHMVIDHVALQALEISRTARDRSKRGSLLHIMDKTLTAMGGRLLASRISETFYHIP
jgi:DNA mismatch repair protein MutS